MSISMNENALPVAVGPSARSLRKVGASALVAGDRKPDSVPKASVVHDPEGRVESIVVTCSCGEELVIECLYKST